MEANATARTSCIAALTTEYMARTAHSAKLHDRLCRCLPGGETRSVTHYDPYPVALTEGQGSVVRDLDGNEYLDLLNNYTALVHGHAFPPVTAAVQTALSGGSVFPAPHIAQLELASLLAERYPAVQRVRFTNSGTEAALLALRLARAVTGRRKLLLFEGGYHGSGPEFIDGGPETVRVPYNDVPATATALDSSTAAVFAEPFLGSSGVIPADPTFLQYVQDRAHAVGAVFVLDEIQALRNSVHGTHASLALKPDLLLMGKIIGGGFPVGAVGGEASLLDLTSAKRADGPSYSGTFNGNMITMIAGTAALRALDQKAITELNDRAGRLAGQIEAAASSAGLPCLVTRAGSILHVHLSTDGLTRALHLALLLAGIYAAPRGMINLSTALDDGQLMRVAAGYEEAFPRIQQLAEP